MSYKAQQNNYASYESAMYSQASQNVDDWDFLQNNATMGVFGVGKEFGQIYENEILNEFQDSFTELNTFVESPHYTKLNKVGKPEVMNSFLFNSISPNNLRYCHHALTVLKDLKKKANGRPIQILEIGAGYGGLAVWLSKLAPMFGLEIQRYTVCDLPGATLMQKKYAHLFDVTLEALHTNFKGWQPLPLQEAYVYCVSCYGYSQISEYYQKLYSQHLISKSEGGFMVWNNWTGIYPFTDKTMVVLPESPVFPNCPNKFIYF